MSQTPSAWSEHDLPDLTGRHIVITGANSGIGFEAARMAAARGARVVLACRNPDKGNAALERIRASSPNAQVQLAALDLASLDSIRKTAEDLKRQLGHIDILCNNAGVMALPHHLTADGFEMQFGTNHLGHFAWTGQLLSSVLAAPAGRIVTVTSNAHKVGRMDWDDLHGHHHYQPWAAYAQSKLANLLFTYALQRRLDSAGTRVIALAAHPGYSATNLPFVAPEMTQSRWRQAIMHLGNSLIAQGPSDGALPLLCAATHPEAQGGDYWGPSGYFEMRGPPIRVTSNARSHDRKAQERLWEISVQETDVAFSALSTPMESDP